MKSRRFKINPRKQIRVKSNTTLFIFISFAAILSVVVLGYISFSDHGETAPIDAVQKNSGVTPTLPIEERIKKQIRAKLPSDEDGMNHPDAVKLYGRWYTKIATEGIAEITFMSDGYELIYVDSPNSRVRKYSKGRYTYDSQTGYLGLFPQRDAQLSALYKNEVLRYKVMTMRNYQMIVLQKPGESTFYMIAHERDLAGKNYHPLFMYEAYENVPVLEFEPVTVKKK
ncbi:MAG: hypothetical protein KAJ40_06240 [Alphaproteobacteria bacterium]|nr:hypothetical protein [Alphaproteobacteria bacterium]